MFDVLVFDLDGTLWKASTLGWNNGRSYQNHNNLI